MTDEFSETADRVIDEPSRVVSAGWPMCTCDVSDATKRIKRDQF